MLRYLILKIWFLLFLFDYGHEVGWIWDFHGGFDEDDGNNDDINKFLRMVTWRIRFLVDGIKMGKMPSSSNNFLRSLLCFIIFRS